MTSTPSIYEIRGTLPAGVVIVPLVNHRDERGCFTEIFRDTFPGGVRPCQWNLVQSAPGTLRGVHVHHRHADYLVLASGHATFGLSDLRRESPTTGAATMVEVRGIAPVGIVIPPGVAHGFYFHEHSVHVYGVTEYWSMSDELGCRWDYPGLGLTWPSQDVILSPRDQKLPPLSEIIDDVPAWTETAFSAPTRV